ncbi:jg4774 [Pararge aegeria aegeria]|uniref:Jg4774 protein n=1 Tax=Pararge aegeria aegeria TaxID=348720 RepID=A0A8S4R5N1_9NEOP|nr:jg4774 [Pararge aegeria aegeria]
MHIAFGDFDFQVPVMYRFSLMPLFSYLQVVYSTIDLCKEVIFRKEAAERMRKGAVDAHPLRRRRGGRRRRKYAARLRALGASVSLLSEGGGVVKLS